MKHCFYTKNFASFFFFTFYLFIFTQKCKKEEERRKKINCMFSGFLYSKMCCQTKERYLLSNELESNRGGERVSKRIVLILF